MVYLFQESGQMQTQSNTTQVLPETAWNSEPLPSGIPPEGRVVVTIARQFGSGGAEIGHLVAETSNLHYVDYGILEEVARRLGVDVERAARQDEQTAGMAGHIFDAIRTSNPFIVNYGSLFNQPSIPTQSKELAYLRLTQRVVLELATEGDAVIVGRGSQFLLHNASRTLHIYIFAPLPYRIENVMKQFHLNHVQAERLIEQRDYEHDSYLRRYYGSDGHQPSLYHLLINTSLFSLELAADLIHQAVPVIKALV
ncbi:MAG: cytidylate kinase-like family protein [Ktedonobacteraceae bacterium]